MSISCRLERWRPKTAVASVTPASFAKTPEPALSVFAQPFRRLLAHWPGRDAEPVEAIIAAHAVEQQRFEIVGREWFSGHEVEHAPLQAAQCIGEADDPATHAALLGNPFDDLAQGPGFSATQFVDFAEMSTLVQCAHERLDHIPDVDRRELRVGPGQWKHRRNCQKAGKPIQEAVIRPEDGGGTKDRPAQTG